MFFKKWFKKMQENKKYTTLENCKKLIYKDNTYYYNEIWDSSWGYSGGYRCKFYDELGNIVYERIEKDGMDSLTRMKNAIYYFDGHLEVNEFIKKHDDFFNKTDTFYVDKNLKIKG